MEKMDRQPDPYETLDEWLEGKLYASESSRLPTDGQLAKYANEYFDTDSFTRKEIGQAMIGICRRKNYDIISYPFSTDS